MADEELKQNETAPEAELDTAAETAENTEASAPEADASANEGEQSRDDIIAGLEEQVAAAQDTALRATAEAQNIKRRAEQDVEKARKFALERFAGELLSVVDNLERALESASGEDGSSAVAEGVELTLKGFLDVLKKYHVEPVNPEGEPFDPQLHQAMTMVENPDVEPNTVLTVMQKGYTLNGRLIRPAMVMVSKG